MYMRSDLKWKSLIHPTDLQKIDCFGLTATLELCLLFSLVWSDTESVVKAKEEVGSISQRKSKDGSLRLENQRFTYAEIIAITNNFETVIGEGGFGVVYHGYVKGAIQVAVKMLSKSSSQGSREFRTEASVLCSV